MVTDSNFHFFQIQLYRRLLHLSKGRLIVHTYYAMLHCFKNHSTNANVQCFVQTVCIKCKYTTSYGL